MISAIILSKNEEKNIDKCLASVDFCDEVIIVEDSNDGKGDKGSKGNRIKILRRRLGGDFAGQRNWAMDQAEGEWILFVDDDEVVSGDLKKELIQKTSSKKQDTNSVYYIKRREWFWGREVKFGEIATARNKGIIRLVRKGSGKWVGKVHETFVPVSTGLLRHGVPRNDSLSNYIDHYPHQNISKFLKHINFYSTLRAQELYLRNKKTDILSIIFVPIIKFKYTYFIKLGFLDGPAGFVYSFMMALHSFLVRSKLYLLRNKRE